MRILVIIHEYPPVGGGGGQIAQNLCEALAERGHEIMVLTSDCNDLPNLEEYPHISIKRLKTGRKENFRASLSVMAKFVFQCILKGNQAIKEWKPDVIHVHFAVPGGAAAWWLSKVNHIPYVLTVHLGDVPGGVPEKTGKWFKWVYPFTPPIWRDAAKVVAVSDFTRDLALKKYQTPIEVIPNGVDIHQINPGTIKLNHPPHIVFAGRFMPQKNPLGLVRILAKCWELPWTATLIGDGPLRPAVEQEVEAAGLDDRIQMTGWISPKEVIEWYQKSDMMVLPSLSEGLPIVGIQGGAMGLVLLLSRVGGNVDLVKPGENGQLIEVGDDEGFAAAIKELLTNPEQLLAQRIASREMAKRFDLCHIVDQYLDVFETARKP